MFFPHRPDGLLQAARGKKEYAVMQVKPTVLIAEDDEDFLGSLSQILQSAGYRILAAGSGSSALSMVSSHCPDLILLNLGLPDMDGCDILASVRKWSDVPVVMLSSRSDEASVVRALDMGADDYIVKPFRTPEMLARLRAALRRSTPAGSEPGRGEKFRCGNLVVDFAQRRVTESGREIHLTLNEFKIVQLLARHAGEVLGYSYLLEHVWGNFAADDRQILRVNMANIRRKIEQTPSDPRYFLTEVGVGYRMADHLSLP